jgi:hypothetical protein
VSEDPAQAPGAVEPPVESEAERLYKIAVMAGITIATIYEMLDMIDKGGGLINPKGVAATNAMLTSLRRNRARIETTIMAPMRKEVQLNEMRQSVGATKQ